MKCALILKNTIKQACIVGKQKNHYKLCSLIKYLQKILWMHLKQFFITTRIFRININDKVSGPAMVRPASSEFWKA